MIKVVKCKYCPAKMVWLKTERGKSMPVDAATVTEGDELFDDKKHVAHWATCTNPPKRKGKKKPQRKVETEPDWSGNCEVCGATPIVPTSGMCGPCTFGEAATADGNW